MSTLQILYIPFISTRAAVSWFDAVQWVLLRWYVQSSISLSILLWTSCSSKQNEIKKHNNLSLKLFPSCNVTMKLLLRDLRSLFACIYIKPVRKWARIINPLKFLGKKPCQWEVKDDICNWIHMQALSFKQMTGCQAEKGKPTRLNLSLYTYSQTFHFQILSLKVMVCHRKKIIV